MKKEQINKTIDKMLYLPANEIKELIKDENIDFLFHDRLAELAITEDPKELKIFDDIYETDYMLIAQAIAENRQTPDYILEYYSDIDNMDFKGKHQVQREAIENKKEKDREMDFFPM